MRAPQGDAPAPAQRSSSPKRGGSSSYAGTRGRPELHRSASKLGGAAPARGGSGASGAMAELSLVDADEGGSVGDYPAAGMDAPSSPRRRNGSPPPRKRDGSPPPRRRNASPPPPPPQQQQWEARDPREPLWGADDASASELGSAGGSGGDGLGYHGSAPAIDAELLLRDVRGSGLVGGGDERDAEAVARRIAGLEQLTAAQRRALSAMATDRAALEHALGGAQLRFTSELEARRGAEAAATAASDALGAERTRLATARAAWSAHLVSAEGATALAEKLEAARTARAAAAEELVAQHAIAEDATHELEGAQGRVAYDCACEREALLTQHASELADTERALARAKAELAHAIAQQSWELERMRAAAEATAGVAADALTSADARKRDLEGMNDAMVSLSERLYVGSLSIGALGVAAGSSPASGALGSDDVGGGVPAWGPSGTGVAAVSPSRAAAGNGGAAAASGAAAGGDGLQWELAPAPLQRQLTVSPSKRRPPPPPAGDTPPQRRGASPAKGGAARRHWAAANATASVARPRGRAPP
jgi:hypothetical protein